jgi:hypothetical protein
VGFEPTIPAFKRAKIVHASDPLVTVIDFRAPPLHVIFVYFSAEEIEKEILLFYLNVS